MNRNFWSALLLLVVLPLCCCAFDLLEITDGGERGGNGGCQLALSDAAVQHMSGNHWVAPSKIVIGNGRPKSGTTVTLARLARVFQANGGSQGTFERQSPKTIATAQLVQVGKGKGESILLVDVDSIGTRPERSECIAKALTILSIVPGGALLLSDFEQVTTGTLEMAEALARRAEIFQLSVDDPDASALIAALVAPPSSTTEAPPTSRDVQRRLPEESIPSSDHQDVSKEVVPTSTPNMLLLVASKASECDVPAIRVSSSEEGLAHLFDDVEAEEVQGVRQVFETMSTATVPHSALCPGAMDGAYSAIAERIREWDPPMGGELKSTGLLTVLQFVLSHAKCCYPALPSVWAAWGANIEHAAVDHAVRLFVAELTFAVQHVAHPRAQRHLLAHHNDPSSAVANAGALVVPEMIDTAVAHRVFDLPSQSEFELAAGSLRKGAIDRVSKLLFKMNKRASTQLLKRLDVEEKRIKSELKSSAIITILDYSESCVSAAGREEEIRVLPISSKKVEKWAEKVSTGCMALFDTHLGKFQDMAPVELATQRRRLAASLKDQHKATSKRNDEKIADRLRPALSKVVDSIWPSFSSAEAVPRSQVEKACEAGGETLAKSWKQKAASAVAPWVTDEKSFDELQKEGRGELAERCTEAKRNNRAKVSKFLSLQVNDAFTPFGEELDRIRSPEDPDEIDVVVKTSTRQAVDDLASGVRGYSPDEVQEHRDALDQRMKEKEAQVRHMNTKAWDKKLPHLKSCAKKALDREVETTSFYTVSAVVQATKTAANECFRSSASTRRDMPKRVLADVVEVWNKETFFVNHQKAATFRLESLGFGVVVVMIAAVYVAARMKT